MLTWFFSHMTALVGDLAGFLVPLRPAGLLSLPLSLFFSTACQCDGCLEARRGVSRLGCGNGQPWKCYSVQGPVSRNSRKLFGPEKPIVKLRPAYSVKLVFSYVVKGVKIKITAKFRASRRLRFEDTKRIMSIEIRPKSFGTFEKRAPGVAWPTSSGGFWTFQAPNLHFVM